MTKSNNNNTKVETIETKVSKENPLAVNALPNFVVISASKVLY